MTIKTLWTGAGNDLMILILKKLILIHLIIQVSGSIDVKMDGSISSKLVGSLKLFYSETALCFYKFTMHSSTEYCCQFCIGTSSSFINLYIVDKSKI